ncbi:hypothetical protein F2P81_000233 [Scophthalmus maximus]|uniref:Uncharacterized protein n=1 Tax=Scophthalmus maximus TaxID=52904 RepID=A0A6A4TSN1_SCOMX|nr:hypothetical protein F2P81_000233 [Scophthalmus maximus]
MLLMPLWSLVARWSDGMSFTRGSERREPAQSADVNMGKFTAEVSKSRFHSSLHRQVGTGDGERFEAKQGYETKHVRRCQLQGCGEEMNMPATRQIRNRVTSSPWTEKQGKLIRPLWNQRQRQKRLTWAVEKKNWAVAQRSNVLSFQMKWIRFGNDDVSSYFAHCCLVLRLYARNYNNNGGCIPVSSAFGLHCRV